MIQAEEFLKRVLSYYRSSFDITAPYTLGGRTYPALAALHAHEDQYVRLVGTTLWNADSHEYTLFDTFANAPTAEQVEERFQAAAVQMEELFVRQGQPLPPKEHQYTWLTVVLLSQQTPGPEARQAVERCRQTKYYQFYLRGYSEVRVILVDLESRTLVTNRAGRSLKKLYKLALQNAAGAEK